MCEELALAASRPEGPQRVAAVASWFQSLFLDSDQVPTLVGGGAVELYTGGAYRSEDLDFVGIVTEDVAEKLQQAGFVRHGRHWIHRRYRLLLEVPDRNLDSGDTVATIRLGSTSVVVLGVEELIVDRLAAWQFWRSEIDGYNAWRLWSRGEPRMELARLRSLAARNEVTAALESLVEFSRTHRLGKPTHSQIEEWTRTPP